MKNKILLVALLISAVTYGQKSELGVFENLMNKTWKADGNWGDGSKFKQEITMNYSLDSTLVIVNSIGFVDKKQTKLGHRNHGVRQYDKASQKIKFWEFDVFGGVTKGIVFAEGKNIVYQYKYGETVVTDMWEYVNENTYNFKVGDYKDGKWKQVYLSTQFLSSK